MKMIPCEWHTQHIQCALQVSDRPLQNVHLRDPQQTNLVFEHNGWVTLSQLELYLYPVLSLQELKELPDKRNVQMVLLGMPYLIPPQATAPVRVHH